MTYRAMLPTSLCCMLCAALCAAAEDNWPQWRGPDQNGIAAARDLPDTWTDTENVVWKVKLPSWGAGSPVVWGDRVFITSASGDVPPAPPNPDDAGKAEWEQSADAGGAKVLLLCLAKQDGAELWRYELESTNEAHYKQNFASPTPVTDGTHIWAMSGGGVITALTLDGQVVWTHNLQKEYYPFGYHFGYSSSPVLCNGKIIIQVTHGYTTDDPSYLIAYNAKTGALAWRVERNTDALLESPDAYSTPAILQFDGKTQIVISGADYVTGHDPDTGAEVWRAAGLNPKRGERNRMIASPVAVDGMIYAPSTRKPTLALRAGGTGDITTSHLAWIYDEMGPDVPTPACDGKLLYLVDDRGVITCFDAKTGTILWGPERTAKGAVSSSPIVADGKIFIINEEGVTSVLAAGTEFRAIAENALPSEGRTLATPAVAGDRLFLRTPTHLYCIGKAT